ncbi:hypothetical protein A2U01_0110702, partial [Trifolium medium]|nr:hypothetical protein [Trifolium medium]
MYTTPSASTGGFNGAPPAEVNILI